MHILSLEFREKTNNLQKDGKISILFLDMRGKMCFNQHRSNNFEVLYS